MRGRHETARLGWLLLAAAACAGAAEPETGGLGWMSGHWCGGNGESRIDETWLPEHAGRLYGLSRTTRGARGDEFEYLRIDRIDGVATYLAQPGGRAATAFPRTAGGAQWVRFENPAHDFPKRIEYRRDGDRLHAEIAGPGRDGAETVIPFEYRRCGE